MYPKLTDESAFRACPLPDFRCGVCEVCVPEVVLGCGEIDETLSRHVDQLKGVNLIQNLLLSTSRSSKDAVMNWRPLDVSPSLLRLGSACV